MAKEIGTYKRPTFTSSHLFVPRPSSGPAVPFLPKWVKSKLGLRNRDRNT